MSRPCPLLGVAISQDCVDCDTKECRMKHKYKTVCIGIDQSYKNTGVSVSADGRLLKVSHIQLDGVGENSLKRFFLQQELKKVFFGVVPKAEKTVCVIERIRLQSRGFVNINYIKSIGALNALITDVAYSYGVHTYSVDTRCWKAQVVGTSKPEDNDYGVPPEKWPTVKWTCNQGFRKQILRKVTTRRENGTFTKNGIKYEFDNDASDSAAISMFYFVGDKSKLKEEK